MKLLPFTKIDYMIRSVLRKYFDFVNYAVGQNTVGKNALLFKRSFAYILTSIL